MATLAEEYDDLYEAKKEIADAITDVGEKFGVKANEADSFRSYADKILKIGNSIWSSAEDSEEQHLLITENGYYDVNDLSKQYFDDADKYSAVSSLWISVQSAPVEIGGKCLWIGDAEEIEIARPEPLVRGSDYATYDAFIDALVTALNATKTKVTISYSDYYRIECPNGGVFWSWGYPGTSNQIPGPYPGGCFLPGQAAYKNVLIYGNQYVLIFMEYDSRHDEWNTGGLGVYTDNIPLSKGSMFENTYYNFDVNSYGETVSYTLEDYWVPKNQLRIGYNTMGSTVHYNFDHQYGKMMSDVLVSKFEIGMLHKRDECPPSRGDTIDLGEYALYFGDLGHTHGKQMYDISGLSIDGSRFAALGCSAFKRIT